MADKTLVGYIREHLSKGYSAEQLKQHILSEGMWLEQDVDQAIREAKGYAQSFPRRVSAISDFDKAPVSNDAIKPEIKRPTALKIVVWAYMITGILAIILNSYSIVHYQSPQSFAGGTLYIGGLAAIFGTIGIITGFFNIFIGWALWKLKNWARIIAIAFSILALLTIIGIPIGAIFLYLLLRKDVKEAFGVETK